MPQQITQITDPPLRGQSEAEFVPRANNTIGVQFPRMIDEMNAMAIELNGLGETVSADASSVETLTQTFGNFLGRWSDLLGAASPPACVSHDNTLWVLVQNIDEIADVEPGTDPAYWQTVFDLMGYVEVDLSTEFISASDKATPAEFAGNAAGKVLTTDAVWGAAAFAALTDAVTTQIDLGTAINFTWATGGNRTLANPTGATPGQQGMIDITKGGTHTLSFGSAYAFVGGAAPTLSGGSGTRHVLSYTVLGDGKVLIAAAEKVS